MSDFKAFSNAVHKQYELMVEHELYVVDTLDIFESYLSFFPEGTNVLFRERTEHDCNCCKNFIRRLGNLVCIVNDQIITVWDDYESLPYPYNIVSEKMAALVKQVPIRDIFRSKERMYGSNPNVDTHDDLMWHHFVGKVHTKHFTTEPGTAMGEFRAKRDVFKRGLEEITLSDMETVNDMIDAGSIYRSQEHQEKLKAFMVLKREYEASGDRELFIWANANRRGATIRNSVMGTLLTDLAEGMDIEDAVKAFESKVAPQNYKRSSAIISPKMIEDAVKTLKDLGLEGAVHRRLATLKDVSVNDVLFVDGSVRGLMKDSLTTLLMTEAKAPQIKLDDPESIWIHDFVDTVLPNAEQIQLLVKNENQGNFMTLTGGDGPERLFKWNNNFAWSYDGEVTDSIKQRVKAAGGRTVGTKLRVSLSWFNTDDLDLHCRDAYNRHIYYASKHNILDVDMNAYGPSSTSPVENMSWMNNPHDGLYNFTVDQFTKRNSDNVGFILEVEYDGKIEHYHYERMVTGTIQGLIIEVKNGKVVSVTSDLQNNAASNDKWGIKTETLVPVNCILNSPNHWNDQKIGNKHWFFILEDCINPEPVRGIYNEFLRDDLHQHRKVFERLGSKTKCPYSENQLSGLGFSVGRDDHAIVTVKKGNSTRAYDIKF